MNPTEPQPPSQPDTTPESAAAPVQPSTIAQPTPTPVVMPATPPPTMTPFPDTQPSHRLRNAILMALIIIIIASSTGAAGYYYGRSKIQQPVATPAPAPDLTVPADATILAQCAKGRGTQYALPKDIPLGPVYNVYQGKVIGLEFMIGRDDLLSANKNYLNLPLFGQKYDHINIGLLSQGHAGYPVPHYHVDLFTIPDSVSKAITCS